MKLKTRILVFMMLTSILPVGFLGLMSYNVSRRVGMNQTLQIFRYNLETYDANLTILFNSLVEAMRTVLADKKQTQDGVSITDILKAQSDTDTDYKKFYYASIIDTKLKNIMTNDNILNIFLSDGADYQYTNGFSPRMLKNPFGDVPLRELSAKRWYGDMLALRGKELLLGYNVFEGFTDAGFGGSVFSCVKQLIDTNTFSDIGFMALSVDKGILQTVFPKGGSLKNSAYLLVDNSSGDKPLIVFKSGEISGVDGIIANYYSGVHNSKWIIGAMKNDISGWDILYLIDKNEAYKSSNIIGFFTVSTTVGVIFATVMLCFALVASIMRPIVKLQKAIMPVAAGKPPVLTEPFGDDEIGQIGTEFVKTVNDNLELQQRLYNSVIKKKEAEFKALQAQINPHFLYNTLDTIYFMASIKGIDDIAQMAVSLSELFKFYLDTGNDFTTVADEIRIINSYLSIQKIRYRDKITYDIAIDEALYGYKILKLILQPIIENAIYHGLEPKVGKGRIRIGGERTGDGVRFVIEDDGVGIDAERGEFKGFGLQNVSDRLKLFYGDGCELQFDSTKGVGTKVTINLPEVRDVQGGNS